VLAKKLPIISGNRVVGRNIEKDGNKYNLTMIA